MGLLGKVAQLAHLVGACGINEAHQAAEYHVPSAHGIRPNTLEIGRVIVVHNTRTVHRNAVSVASGTQAQLADAVVAVGQQNRDRSGGIGIISQIRIDQSGIKTSSHRMHPVPNQLRVNCNGRVGGADLSMIVPAPAIQLAIAAGVVGVDTHGKGVTIACCDAHDLSNVFNSRHSLRAFTPAHLHSARPVCRTGAVADLALTVIAPGKNRTII